MNKDYVASKMAEAKKSKTREDLLIILGESLDIHLERLRKNAKLSNGVGVSICDDIQKSILNTAVEMRYLLDDIEEAESNLD